MTRNGNERATERDNGSQQIEWLVDARRDQVLFEVGLCAVDQRLQQAEGADTSGSPAILDAAYQLALQQHGVGDAHEHHHRDHGYLEQAPQEKF